APAPQGSDPAPGGAATLVRVERFASGQTPRGAELSERCQCPSARTPAIQPSPGEEKIELLEPLNPGAAICVHSPFANSSMKPLVGASATSPLPVEKSAVGTAAGWASSRGSMQLELAAWFVHQESVTCLLPRS